MELYPDVPQDHWAYNDILWARRLGLMVGYPDGLFRPLESMTRAEEAATSVRIFWKSVLFGAVGGALLGAIVFPRRRAS